MMEFAQEPATAPASRCCWRSCSRRRSSSASPTCRAARNAFFASIAAPIPHGPADRPVAHHWPRWRAGEKERLVRIGNVTALRVFLAAAIAALYVVTNILFTDLALLTAGAAVVVFATSFRTSCRSPGVPPPRRRPRRRTAPDQDSQASSRR